MSHSLLYRIKIFSTVYFPCPKILNLCGVWFECKMGEMNFSFPVLEKFEARYCTCNQSVPFTVPLIERITIDYGGLSCFYSPHDHAITFSASSHLKEFTYRGIIKQDIILFDPSSACNSSINLFLKCKYIDKL